MFGKPLCCGEPVAPYLGSRCWVLLLRLGSSDDNLNNLMAAWAEAEGVYKTSSIGAFEPTPPP
jgi:hypothetical protein